MQIDCGAKPGTENVSVCIYTYAVCEQYLLHAHYIMHHVESESECNIMFCAYCTCDCCSIYIYIYIYIYI